MSGALAFDAAWIFAGFLIIVVFAAGGIAVRRMLLDRGGGTVECGLRHPGESWRLGVAAYRADELRWYDGVGVLLTPEEVLKRRTLSVDSRRQAEPAEEARLGPDMMVVACKSGDQPERIELAMGESALTGFLAWLEAAPPGSYHTWVNLRSCPAGPALEAGPGPGACLSARRQASRARRRVRRSPRGRG